MIILPYEITIEDLRVLTNETQEVQLCASMFKNKALIKKNGVWTEIPNAVSISGNIITVNQEACVLLNSDILTIEIDKGESLSDIELPEIDTAGLSLQGTNPEATNTKVLEEILKVSDAQAQIDELIAIQLQTIIGE